MVKTRKRNNRTLKNGKRRTKKYGGSWCIFDTFSTYQQRHNGQSCETECNSARQYQYTANPYYLYYVLYNNTLFAFHSHLFKHLDYLRITPEHDIVRQQYDKIIFNKKFNESPGVLPILIEEVINIIENNELTYYNLRDKLISSTKQHDKKVSGPFNNHVDTPNLHITWEKRQLPTKVPPTVINFENKNVFDNTVPIKYCIYLSSLNYDSRPNDFKCTNRRQFKQPINLRSKAAAAVAAAVAAAAEREEIKENELTDVDLDRNVVALTKTDIYDENKRKWKVQREQNLKRAQEIKEEELLKKREELQKQTEETEKAEIQKSVSFIDETYGEINRSDLLKILGISKSKKKVDELKYNLHNFVKEYDASASVPGSELDNIIQRLYHHVDERSTLQAMPTSIDTMAEGKVPHNTTDLPSSLTTDPIVEVKAPSNSVSPNLEDYIDKASKLEANHSVNYNHFYLKYIKHLHKHK